MPLTLALVTPPLVEPVSLDEAKLHCRVSIDEDDTLILSYIQAAREYLEVATRRAFLTQTLRLSLDDFPSGWGGSHYGHHGHPGGMICLPRPPLQSVTEVTYLDSAGAPQTLDTAVYGVDTDTEPGRLWLQPAQSWPSSYEVPNAVQITYVAGWTTRERVPASLKAAMLLLVGHFYENREMGAEKALAEIPFGVTTLMWSNRIVEAA